MKNISRIILSIASLIFASTTFAASPITIINNTTGNIIIGYSHCNKSNMCTFVHYHQLDNKDSGNHAVQLVAPVKMDNLTINSAKLIDKNQNTVSKLTGGCSAPSNATAVSIENYGTGKLFCHFLYGV